MKTSLSLLRLLTTAGVAALIAIATSVRAAEPQRQIDSDEAWNKALATHRGGLVIKELGNQGSCILLENGDYTSLTLGNVVAVIRHLFPKQNIIISGNPEFHFKNVTLNWKRTDDLRQLDATLDVLVAASNGAFTVKKVWPADGTHTVESTSNGLGLAWDNSAYVFSFTAPKPAAAPVLHVAVFNLAPQRDPALAATESELRNAQAAIENLVAKGYLEGHPEVRSATSRVEQLKEQQRELTLLQNEATARRMNEIESIVAETLRDLAIKDSPTFRFHQGTNLLIVTGTDDALEVVAKIVTALGGTTGSDGGFAGPAGPEGSRRTQPRFESPRSSNPASLAVANQAPGTATEWKYETFTAAGSRGQMAQPSTPSAGSTIVVAADGKLYFQNQPIPRADLVEKLKAYRVAASPAIAEVSIQVFGLNSALRSSIMSEIATVSGVRVSRVEAYPENALNPPPLPPKTP